MKRVTKNPEERKRELIDVADRLFMEKGYEQTAVSDIVREIGVAQGTFYYYFSSKEDMLEAVIEEDIAALEKKVRQIISGEHEDAAAKLNSIVNNIIGISTSRKGIMDYLHNESNAIMHEKMERQTVERLAPLMTEVVIKGIKTGRFEVQFPSETVEFLLASMVYFFHHPEILADPSRSDKMRRTLETMLSRVLGAKEFNFVIEV